jgi:hypothetical protein
MGHGASQDDWGIDAEGIDQYDIYQNLSWG